MVAGHRDRAGADESREDGRPRYLPLLGWIRHYDRGRLRRDAVGALTAWAILVPESMAYAQLAGVPPQNAFYAAPIVLVVYAVLGSSHSLVVGATSAASILSASTVAGVAGDPGDAVQLSAALALMTGIILLLSGLLRLGFVANFLAEPALVGFLFGMALTIVGRQAGTIVGVSTGSGDFFERLWTVLSDLDEGSAVTFLVGAIALLLLWALQRFSPMLPAALAVLAIGITLSYTLALHRHGVAIVGRIPSAVPDLQLPHVDMNQLARMSGGSFALVLVIFAESYSVANRFARAHGYEVDANQELIGLGTANIASGFFRGFVVSGSASRTAVVERTGRVTQMMSLIAAALVLVTAAFLTPLFTRLPEPVLAAIVIVAVSRFFRADLLREYWRRDRLAFAVAATALFGVLIFDLIPGLVAAVALSLVLVIAYASTPRVAELGRTVHGEFVERRDRTDVTTRPGLLLIRPDGELFFGNISRVRHAVLQLTAATDPPPDVVCLVLSATYHLGIEVLDGLGELEEHLRQYGRALWLADVPSQVRPQLDQDPLGARLGDGRIWPSVAAADEAFADGRRT